MKRFNYRILFLLSILLFSCFLYTGYQSKMEHFNKSDIEIVISRYNEPLEWIKDSPFSNYNAIVYNKGPNEEFEKTPNIKRIVPLENVGREGHTHLYHIINNYDNLAEITVFLPGSCNMQNKKDKAKKLIEKIEEYDKAVFVSDETHNCVKTVLYHFQLDEYTSSDDSNRSINPENILEKSNIRPFGKWFETNFGDTVTKNISYLGIYSISKQDILQHPIEHYKKLLEQLETSSNPEVGHYIERSWAAIFHPMNNTEIV